MIKVTAYLVLLGCALLFAFVIFLDIDSIVGAYGDGPPYYGRTTNMDKWESPVPALIIGNGFSILVIFLAGRWAYRQIRRH